MRNIFICLSLFLSAQIFAQSTNELSAKLQQELDKIQSAHKTPGVTFSAVLPNGELVAIASGLADVEKEIPMTPEHKMLGGSTGKVFYSVVIMQLVDEGKIDLDEPVSTYLGSYDWYNKLPNASSLTMRALMRHESGIPRYVFKEAFQVDVLKDADKVWKPEELLSYVFDDEPLFAVGEDFAYSDTNYIVACMVVEKVTGKSLYKEVQKRVLKKAGLKYSEPQDKRKYKGMAQGYNGEEEFFPGTAIMEDGKSRYNWQFEWAGGGMVITSQDLAVLGKKIYEGEMFSKSLLENEYLKGRPAKQLGGDWGLGVHMTNTPVGKMYGHSGFMPGYITNMMYFPEFGFSVCYQINGSTPEYMSIMRDLMGLAAIVKENLPK